VKISSYRHIFFLSLSCKTLIVHEVDALLAQLVHRLLGLASQALITKTGPISSRGRRDPKHRLRIDLMATREKRLHEV
jgi:hypothetical protein